MESVDLNSVVDLAVELSSPLIKARRHQLFVSCKKEPMWLRGDSTRLAQVLANLLNNAAKYTDPGGQIWLSVERELDHATVRVRDNGIGIPPHMLGSIFNLFTQVDRSLDRSQGGLGIGLTLVRHLVEMHGGKVSVSSPGPGLGSEFLVQLPLLIEQTTTAVQPGGLRPSVGLGRRVLVVDDNRDIAESLSLLLTHSGHEVRIVHDGPSALSAAQEFLPQVILLDIGLPEIDGYEVARRIRKMPALAGVKLVAVTGYGQPEERRRAMEAGFDVHLVKPVDLLTLKDLLDRLSSTSQV